VTSLCTLWSWFGPTSACQAWLSFSTGMVARYTRALLQTAGIIFVSSGWPRSAAACVRSVRRVGERTPSQLRCSKSRELYPESNDSIPNDNVSNGLYSISKMQLVCIVAVLDDIRDALIEVNLDLRETCDMLSQCAAELSSMKCGAPT